MPSTACARTIGSTGLARDEDTNGETGKDTDFTQSAIDRTDGVAWILNGPKSAQRSSVTQVVGPYASRRDALLRTANEHDWAKWRYVDRMCVFEVRHEPPRRTNWPDMNFPLYSPTAPAGGRYRG
jgi:hypothetical protein